MIIGVGDALGTRAEIAAWQRAYSDAASAIARALVLSDSALLVDAGATSYAEFQARLAEAIEASSIAAAKADELDRLAQSLLNAHEGKTTDARAARSVASVTEAYLKPTSASKPQALTPIQPTSRDIRNLLRASYNDVNSLRQSIRLARNLGFSSRFIAAQLRTLEGQATSEAFTQEAEFHRLAENTSIVIKDGASVVVFVGSVFLSGGATAAAAGGSATAAAAGTGAAALQTASTVISGAALATTIVEDTAYIAFGTEDKPPIFQGIQRVSDIVSLVNIADPQGVANTILWIGGHVANGLPTVLEDNENTLITVPTSPGDPTLEFEELTDEEFAEAYQEFEDAPEALALTPGHYRLPDDSRVTVPGLPDDIKEILDEAPLALPEADPLGVPPYHLPPGLVLINITRLPPDSSGIVQLAAAIENISAVPHDIGGISGTFTDSSGRAEPARVGRRSDAFLMPGEVAVVTIPSRVPDGFPDDSLRLTLEGDTRREEFSPRRGVLSVVDTIFFKDHRDSYEIHARIGRLKGEGRFSAFVTLIDDIGQVLGEVTMQASSTALWPTAPGESLILEAEVPQHLGRLVDFYRVFAYEPKIDPEFGWTVFEAEGIDEVDLEVISHGVTPTTYFPQAGDPFVINGHLVALISGEVRNNGDKPARVDRVQASWPDGNRSTAFLMAEVLEPNESTPFLIEYHLAHYSSYNPDYDYFSPDAGVPPLPTPAFNVTGGAAALPLPTLELAMPQDALTITTSLDRVFDATGRAKGYRWHTWNTSATNDSDTPVNITGVGLFMGTGGTPLDFQWITGAGLIEPGQTITDSVTMGAAVTGSASISSVWIRGICRDCVVELPPDFGSGSSAGVPEPVDPDVFCQGFRTQSGFDTCKGVVQALENDGQIDIDTQRLAGVTCDDLPFAERQTCRVVVAVETGDKSRLEGLGDEALALYVIMSGDRSVLERISSDSVRDAAYAYLGVVGAARDPANTPPTDYCEGLTLTIDDDDFVGDACEVGVATIRAFNNNDLGECDRLLETMQPYIERYGDPETPFEAQFLCQQHVADMRTLESKFQ
ncbi:MAG: hypothetical protein V3S18_03460 [Dehalococcoidia bacterium]